jgi:hypothetical protein
MNPIILGVLVFTISGKPVKVDQLKLETQTQIQTQAQDKDSPTLWVHCPKKKTSSDCVALNKLERATLKGIPASRFQGGKNPGSVVCSDVLRGEVQIGTDPQGDEQSFCVFNDGSLVSTGSLAAQARYRDSR